MTNWRRSEQKRVANLTEAEGSAPASAEDEEWWQSFHHIILKRKSLPEAWAVAEKHFGRVASAILLSPKGFAEETGSLAVTFQNAPYLLGYAEMPKNPKASLGGRPLSVSKKVADDEVLFVSTKRLKWGQGSRQIRILFGLPMTLSDWSDRFSYFEAEGREVSAILLHESDFRVVARAKSIFLPPTSLDGPEVRGRIWGAEVRVHPKVTEGEIYFVSYKEDSQQAFEAEQELLADHYDQHAEGVDFSENDIEEFLASLTEEDWTGPKQASLRQFAPFADLISSCYKNENGPTLINKINSDSLKDNYLLQNDKYEKFKPF